MSRRGENIRKRKDGRWEARYVKARDMQGKIHYGYIYGKTYREVRQKKAERMTEYPVEQLYHSSKYHLKPNITLNAAAEYWKIEIQHTIKASTYCSYLANLERHILPVLGDYPVKELTSETIRFFVEAKSAQGLAPGSLHVILSILKSVLNFAHEQGVNTAESIKTQHLPTVPGKITLMSMKDSNILETHLWNHPDNFNFGILLCMNTGIRVGELSGLRWEDLNLPEKQISIRRTVNRIKNLEQKTNPLTNKIPKTILHIGTPKSTTSFREIPLPDRLAELSLKLLYAEGTYVLTGTKHCMEPRSIERKYEALLRTCGISHVKFHSLRHLFSSRWVKQGFDTKTLSEVLGHASVHTTLDFYVHMQLDTKRKYMNELMEK